ncbi:hypothetical protein BJ742DRAFT_736718 [Cladochytrium replicatum]|nr:hypothetical protein BJ742DRAFT_736718 [Cladochytrium replicatum]
MTAIPKVIVHQYCKMVDEVSVALLDDGAAVANIKTHSGKGRSCAWICADPQRELTVPHTMLKSVNFGAGFNEKAFYTMNDAKRLAKVKDYDVKVYALLPGAVDTGNWEKGGLSISKEHWQRFIVRHSDEKLSSNSGEYCTNCELGVTNAVANAEDAQRDLKQNAFAYLKLS